MSSLYPGDTDPSVQSVNVGGPGSQGLQGGHSVTKTTKATLVCLGPSVTLSHPVRARILLRARLCVAQHTSITRQHTSKSLGHKPEAFISLIYYSLAFVQQLCILCLRALRSALNSLTPATQFTS